MDTDFCELQCYLEPSCLSFNFMKLAKKCQLNNSTFERQKNKLEKNLDFIYSGAKVSAHCVVLENIHHPPRQRAFLL